jgi:alpha-N-arabinofuranosidase
MTDACQILSKFMKKTICHPLLAALAWLHLCNAADVKIEIDTKRAGAWTISPQLFGSYQEEHWGDITPGIFEQYIVNPSFEPWRRHPDNATTEGVKSDLVFTPPETPGIAYPWEKLGRSENAVFSFSEDCANSRRSQEIKVSGAAAGIRQTLALPDYRVKKYKLRVWARSEGDVVIKAFFLDGSKGGKKIRASERTLAATGKWAPVTATLDLGGELSERHLARFGIARLSLEVSGSGSVWFDQATLYPADAVEGIYNPETLALLAKVRPAAIRWPGGNFTSGYHWRDGIGPVDRRPTLPNRAWGGIEANLVGTDEWLRFCEAMNIEPVMGVGFGEITAEEAADWVEYCNGAAGTPMGKLRAQNGRAKPYNVKYWGAGNEVYGDYQIGHTDAKTYARGLVAMAKAMRERDPSIVIVASACGIHNANRRQHADWNDTVLKIAGGAFDLMDAHYYVYGPSAKALKPGRLGELRRAFMGAATSAEYYYKDLRRQIAALAPGRDIGLVHYEWGVLPAAPDTGFSRNTFLNALATASQFHVFIKNGDFVRGGMMHNFSFYVNPVKAHSEPPNPRTAIFQLYRDIAPGARLVPASVAGPVYEISERFRDIVNLKGVPEVDVVSLLDAGGVLHVCVLNRNLSRAFPVEVRCGDLRSGAASWAVTSFTSDTPTKGCKWDTPAPVMQISRTSLESQNGAATFAVPPASLHHLHIKLP